MKIDYNRREYMVWESGEVIARFPASPNGEHYLFRFLLDVGFYKREKVNTLISQAKGVPA